MSESNLPQPITREEFEAGVKFYYSPKLHPYDYLYQYNYDLNIGQIVVDRNDRHYCNIQTIDKNGFKIIKFIFQKSIEIKVLFKHCYKSLNQ